MSTGVSADEIVPKVRGRLGVITLNRPRALNALNLNMVEQLEVILADWANNPAIDAVLLRSASERAFCAGGDMRVLGTVSDIAERTAMARAFFGTEYRVNYRINTFPKPFISLINGVAMGGGLGLSIHGSHRIVSEDLRMAMPETILGLFPDVGGTWFLNRCPGALGRYLALIGPHLGAADALIAKLATHHVRLSDFAALTEALATAPRLDGSSVDAILTHHATSIEGGMLDERRIKIDSMFGQDNLDVVVAAIDAHASDEAWIGEAQSVIRRASPTSLLATWRRMVEGKGQSIKRVLSDDFRMAMRIICSHDFVEGVRAILVDKDQSPRWNPASLEDVGADRIDALLDPFSENGPVNGEISLKSSL
tara:strand:+ start:15452 stop:16552 length:1101 start_codon:yes stop_codon:yes gene_type:complete